MKIAFVGKGGSGKSTMSWLFANQLVATGSKVLAIDADYNLDLLHNFHLTAEDVSKFLNTAEKDFYKYLGLTEKDYYIDIPNKKNLPSFSFSPRDAFTDSYSFPVGGEDRLRLMVTGMVPNEMLYGHRCGHAYISSLKYYLPLLECQQDQHVLVDAVAGTDLVSYGMFLGCDAVIVVVEETPHSVGVYEQIKTITEEFSIPTFAVLNKYRDSGKIQDFISRNSEEIIGHIPFDETVIEYDFSSLSSVVTEELNNIETRLRAITFDTSKQWQRHVKWRERYDVQLAEDKKKELQFIEE